MSSDGSYMTGGSLMATRIHVGLGPRWQDDEIKSIYANPATLGDDYDRDTLHKWAFAQWQPHPGMRLDADGLSRIEHETRSRAAVKALAGDTAPAS